VDADLNTLATALYVHTDDWLKDNPHRIPWRPKVGIAPMISDAEMVTLSVMQAPTAVDKPAQAVGAPPGESGHKHPASCGGQCRAVGVRQ